jgi:pimeloyl-ACP methyl ester carboxylesterase
MSMKKIMSKDGTEIAYIMTGTGRPLVLVHGTSADHHRWLPIIPSFKEQFTVYAIDRRGRGESGDSTGYTLQKEAEDIAALVDSIEEPVFLLGHSYGGLCCLEAALLTDNILKLILYEPPVPSDGLQITPKPVLDELQELIKQGKNETTLEVFFRKVVKMSEEELVKFRSQPVWNDRVKAAHTIPRESVAEDFYKFEPERFKDLKISVLLLQGGESSPIFTKATRLLHNTLPNSRIAVMAGQKHVAMDSGRELFLSEVKQFLLE